MAKSASAKRKRSPKSVLKLPDLEQSKTAVLNGLTSSCSQRTYEHAIREFIDWYCSEPRLAFNKTVVTRYRIALEQKQYAPSTINLRLAAVRRLAYEAADSGLLSADLAAGIRRVKGARRLGVRKELNLFQFAARYLGCKQRPAAANSRSCPSDLMSCPDSQWSCGSPIVPRLIADEPVHRPQEGADDREGVCSSRPAV